VSANVNDQPPRDEALSAQSWLVRTAGNDLLGPFSQETIREMVRDRKLTALDEVCRANHFWFFLHEEAEVRSQLGITSPVFNPKRRDADEESTQTDIRTDEVDTDKVYANDELPRQRRAKVVPVGSGPVQILRPIERTSFWRGLFWALAVLFVVLVYSVFRILGSAEAPRLPG
jgi:hypothetical protein